MKRKRRSKRYVRRPRRIRFNKRHGGEYRGNSEDRRRRKLWILKTFGDGKTVPCSICKTKLDAKHMTVDRIIPGFKGGSYRHENIRPMCEYCNFSMYSKDPHGYHSEGYREQKNPRRRRKAR